VQNNEKAAGKINGVYKKTGDIIISRVFVSGRGKFQRTQSGIDGK
jgi:hypothetical protein